MLTSASLALEKKVFSLCGGTLSIPKLISIPETNHSSLLDIYFLVMFFLLRISRLNRPFWCITWFWGVPFCFRTTSVGFSIESWTLARLPGNFYRYLVQTKSLLQGLTGLALWSISVKAFWSAQSRRRSNTRKSKLGSSQYDRVNSTKDQKDRHALSMHKLDAFLKGSESGQNGLVLRVFEIITY